MKSKDINLGALAAPFVAEFNKKRGVSDTWEFKAEYLDTDTFVVNAEGLCNSFKNFNRRDDKLTKLKDKIMDAIYTITDSHTPFSERWVDYEIGYWLNNGEELLDDPGDESNWKSVSVAQYMICL